MLKWLNKLKPKDRFRTIFTSYILAQGVAFLTCPLFPIYFNLRFLKKWNPFWFLLDDYRLNEDGSLAEDYRIYLRGFKWKPWGVFCWHICRNRAWNFIEMFPVDNGQPNQGNQNIIITKMIKDDLKDFTGRKLEVDGPYAIGAGLKYVGEPGDNPWQVNRGDIISISHSIIGEAEFYYETPSGWTGWRKSSCKLKKVWWMFGAKRWVTIYRGMNANRYSFKQKYQKDKPKAIW